jgi:hypothetical protein
VQSVFSTSGLWEAHSGHILWRPARRFDLSNLERLEWGIAESEAGRYELHFFQQPPFGFFSGTYLGEIAVCVPLFDSEARIGVLKRRVVPTTLYAAQRDAWPA